MTCPNVHIPVAFDYKNDECYEGQSICRLTDDPCLMESGDSCELLSSMVEEK